MKKSTLQHIIATDPQGLLRMEESRFVYFLKRMWYKVLTRNAT